MNAFHSTPGTSLRELRGRTGMSQLELAERSGLSVRAVRDLEGGRVARPRATSLHRLATAMRLSEAERAALATAVSAGVEPGVRLAVLGPLSLCHRGKPVALTAPAVRTVLVLLALQPQRWVSREEIVDAVWGECPPATCPRLVHRYLGQLRALLEPGRRTDHVVRAEPGGYRLTLPADQLDVARFEELVDSAARLRERGEPRHARTLLAQALAQWRGPAAGGLAGRLDQHPALVALTHSRVTAALDHADLALADGVPAQGVRTLRALADEHPWHEGIAARLMLSLAAGGEQAAALRLFGEVRARLAEQLRVEPGPELTKAHSAVVHGRVPLFPPLSAAAASAHPRIP
ncbi:BTAD domain-containing putative transcriptional regulator [Amycolatopsis magusensis]|uniref:BTAD domain-containing putative transcriptional regulator n=1 Tax=Amycolatopsis magusensis TaxID=882444 RepID=UPI003797B6E4